MVQKKNRRSGGGTDYAERTFLPLALRLARTLRPPTVLIRARKPCVDLFLILLGWYVRFIHATSVFFPFGIKCQ
jgi:hypothetical protein